MTKHDYKAALEAFDRNALLSNLAKTQDEAEFLATIRHALLLADKVTGEPSVEMRKSVSDILAPYTAEKVLKAMIQQAEREIG